MTGMQITRSTMLATAVCLASSVSAAPVVPELALGPATAPVISLEGVLERQARDRALADASRAEAGYQKQTAFDNTPYRFNMKPGEKMNAAQFDAWMASRGIRIVPAKPAAATQTVSQ